MLLVSTTRPFHSYTILFSAHTSLASLATKYCVKSKVFGFRTLSLSSKKHAEHQNACKTSVCSCGMQCWPELCPQRGSLQKCAHSELVVERCACWMNLMTVAVEK